MMVFQASFFNEITTFHTLAKKIKINNVFFGFQEILF